MNSLDEARQVMDKIKGSKIIQNPVKLEEGYLYLMTETGRRYTKIGISNDPRRRQKELDKPRTKMPYDVHLLRKIKVVDYKKTEKVLHQIYDKYRIEDGGEWFDLDPLEITCLMLLSQQQIEDLTVGKLNLRAKGTLKHLFGDFMKFLENPTSSYEEMEVSRQANLIRDLSSLIDQLRSEKISLEDELSRVKIEGITGMKKTENRVRAALRSLEVPLESKERLVVKNEDGSEYFQQCAVCGEMEASRFIDINEPNIEEHDEFYIWESRFHDDRFSILLCRFCNALDSMK